MNLAAFLCGRVLALQKKYEMVKQAPFYHLYDAISAEEVCVLFKNTCLPFFVFNTCIKFIPTGAENFAIT